MRIEPFLPSRHGFAFTSAVELDEPRFGLAVPVAPVFGLSAGMAWAALDRYHAGRPIPALAELPPAGDPLRAEIALRQGAALARAGWAELREWQSLPEHGWPWAAGLADRTRAEWRRLRRRLDAGEPVMLYLVLARGRHANPSGHQAVLAYGYEADRRSGRVSVRVYDPSRPGNDGVRLVFRARGGFRSLDARLAVQTIVRGFFCVPYDRPVPARVRRSDAGALDTREAAALLAVNGTPRSDGALTVLARSEDGRLLQIRRGRRDRWTVSPVQSSGKGAVLVEDASAFGAGHLVLRTATGELVEARRRAPLGWRMRSISGKTVKAPFDATPVALRDRKGNLDVLACRGGRLLHFRRGQLNAWRTTHLKAGPLARAKSTGMPAACLCRNALHVVVRTETAELIHARWRGKQGWSAENITARSGDRARFLLDGDPLVLADSKTGQLNVIGRSRAGAIVLFRWTQRGGWKAQDLTACSARGGVRSASPVAATLDQDGTIHAVGRTDAGGLLHAWCTRDGAAGVQDVTHSRAAIGAGGAIDGDPQVFAAPGGGLHVFARHRTALLLYRWDRAGDWSVEDVSAEHAGPTVAANPVLAAAQGTLHAAVIDEAGRLHHVAVAARTPGGAARVLAGAIADAAALPLTAAALLADLLLLPVRSLACLRPSSDQSADRARLPARAEPVEVASASPHGPEAEVDAFIDVRATPAAHVPDEEPVVPSLAESADAPLGADALEPLPLLDIAASSDAPAATAADAPLEETAVAAGETSNDAAAEDPGYAASAGESARDDAWDLPQPAASFELPVDELPSDEPADLPQPDALELAVPDPQSEEPADLPELEALELPGAELPSENQADLPLLDPISTEESWSEPWRADDSAVPTPEEQEPWKAPVEEVEPWLLTPVEDEPWMTTPSDPEPIAPLPELTPEAADDPADVVELTAPTPEPAPDVDDWSMPALSVDDDWNAPAAPARPAESEVEDAALPVAAAETAAPDASEPPAVDSTAAHTSPTDSAPQPDRAPTHDDWNFPPLESAQAAEPAAPRTPRKWSNPALDGLPLLDDEEPASRPAAASKPPAPAPAPKPEAEPQANGRKKKNRKKSDGMDELQRVMALADKNRPELLPPS